MHNSVKWEKDIRKGLGMTNKIVSVTFLDPHPPHHHPSLSLSLSLSLVKKKGVRVPKLGHSHLT